jgi:hypothetical protein
MCARLGTVLQDAQFERFGEWVGPAEEFLTALLRFRQDRIHKPADGIHWSLLTDAMNDDHCLRMPLLRFLFFGHIVLLLYGT